MASSSSSSLSSSVAATQEDPAVLVSTGLGNAVASSCGVALLLSGVVATTSFLATIRHMWPMAFLLCSMAAALAASRKLDEDDDSWVSMPYRGQRGRARGGGGRPSRQGRLGGSGRCEAIEPLPYPKELKEWVYPPQ